MHRVHAFGLARPGPGGGWMCDQSRHPDRPGPGAPVDGAQHAALRRRSPQVMRMRLMPLASKAGDPRSSPRRPTSLPSSSTSRSARNPETRIAWERAREAALAIGIAESVYAPMLRGERRGGLSAHLAAASQDSDPARASSSRTRRSFCRRSRSSGCCSTSAARRPPWRRRASCSAAANFGFNATHQKVVFDVTRVLLRAELGAGPGRYGSRRPQARPDAPRRGRGTARDAGWRRCRRCCKRASRPRVRPMSCRSRSPRRSMRAWRCSKRWAIRPTTQLRVAGLSGRTVTHGS